MIGSVRARLYCFMALLLTLVWGLAIIGWLAVRDFNAVVDDIITNDATVFQILAEIRDANLLNRIYWRETLAGAEAAALGVNLSFANRSSVGKAVEQEGKMRTAFKRLQDMSPMLDAEDRQFIARIEQGITDFLKTSPTLQEAVKSGTGMAEAGRAMSQAQDHGLIPALNTFFEHKQHELALAEQHAEDKRAFNQHVLIWSAASASVLALVIGGLIGRSIANPLSQLQEMISTISRNKDLTVRAPIVRRDEIGKTAMALNALLGEFHGLIRKIGESADTLANSSGDLATAAEEVAATAQSQADSASAMGAAIEQMTVSVNQIAEQSRVVGTQSDETARESEQGAKLVSGLLGDIERIAGAVHSTSTTVSWLGEQSQEIQKVVGVIREIAEQTNLLALNAAIEAARAGEQGRGFSVVADEVRKLAERSSTSALSIGEMIGAVQAAIGQTVAQMSAEVDEVNKGAELARQVGEVIAQMRTGTSRMVSATHDVAGAIAEQGSASQELARNVEQIVRMTDQTNSAVQQTASAAAVLNDLASQLRAQSAQFKT